MPLSSHVLSFATVLAFSVPTFSWAENPDPLAAPEPPVAAAAVSVTETVPVTPVPLAPTATTPEAAAVSTTPPATANVVPAETPAAPALSQQELDKQLWDAAHAGDVATVKTLLAQGANANIATDAGETALHAAVAAGSLPSVVALVTSGANVNSVTRNGWSPLHHAARFGRADAANYLMQHGANPRVSTRDNPPKTPVQMAQDRGDLRTARILGY